MVTAATTPDAVPDLRPAGAAAHDGEALELVATRAPPLPGVRGHLERQAEQLRVWAADRPAPFLP